MNSPRAIVRNVSIAMVAFGGMMTSHSVKKTTNWSVLIMPHKNFREEPSKIFSTTLPVATVFAAPFAALIVDSIAAAVPGSI